MNQSLFIIKVGSDLFWWKHRNRSPNHKLEDSIIVANKYWDQSEGQAQVPLIGQSVWPLPPKKVSIYLTFPNLTFKGQLKPEGDDPKNPKLQLKKKKNLPRAVSLG